MSSGVRGIRTALVPPHMRGNVLVTITLLTSDVNGLIIKGDNSLYMNVGICDTPPFFCQVNY